MKTNGAKATKTKKAPRASTRKEVKSPEPNSAGKGYLVVVESPAKAKTIKKYLGRNYSVKASVGHVKDLPKSKLGVDPENGFAPTYEVIAGKRKALSEIKKAASASAMTYLATDPDREGEAIAWHIAEEVAGDGVQVQRVLFNEITKKAVQEAIQHPLALDKAKFESQQARRVLDRLVGYEISPILWKKVRRGLSAGRVQSVAVRLVVDREREIAVFVPVEYWTLDAELAATLPPAFVARLSKLDGEKAAIGDRATAEALQKELAEAVFTVTKVERRERRRNPAAPFITSKLQQEAANRLHFSAKKTMMLAQRLYEGIELGPEGAVGLITYMRTDSVRLSEDAVAEARSYIGGKYGKEFLPEKPIVYRSSKRAQDAHEAIRPTSLEYSPERVQPFVEPDMYRLYELIWRRFLACQMMPAVYDQTTVDITAGRGVFRAAGNLLKFEGYLAVYGEKPDEPDAPRGQTNGAGVAPTAEEEAAAEESKALPPLEEGDRLTLNRLLPEQHFTQPPPRFTEASLVKELEEKGIGRPSTYAAILSTIQDKEYVEKRENRFYPTELGTLVTDLLVKAFPRVIDVAFTAGMEEQLDEIAEGASDWVKVLSDFYAPFKVELVAAEAQMRDVKREETPTDLKCDRCGSPMVIKWGKMGRFLACSGYPECKNTMDFEQQPDGTIVPVKEQVTDKLCEKCGRPMAIKRGRFGRFLACTGYPECKSSQPLSLGIPCPNGCGGELTERRTRRGKIFYGCNRYPECTFAAWDKPLLEKCPECASPYLVQRYSKRDGPYIACPNSLKGGSCTYRRNVVEAGVPDAAPLFRVIRLTDRIERC
jgi:DNA topoisomerase-1